MTFYKPNTFNLLLQNRHNYFPIDSGKYTIFVFLKIQANNITKSNTYYKVQ